MIIFKSLSPRGYNLHTGGDNHECSNETKNKLRIAAFGKKASKTTKQRMSISGKRRIFTQITKNRISEALKGRKHSVEHVLHLPQNQTGFHSGEKHPRAIFNNNQIIKIKELVNNNVKYKQIADLFNTTDKHIALIKNGFAYKGIE